jgi:hypothetical protein
VFRLYEVETGHSPQVDNRSGGNEIFLHETKEIDAARLHDVGFGVHSHRACHGVE